MTSLPFTKMHALGNDFVVIRAATGQSLPPPARIRALADRRTGIGFDQLLWLEPAHNPGTAVYYRIFNTDGSEAEQCGNGARCIASLVAGGQPGDLVLESPAGRVAAEVHPDGQVSIAMGEPEFRPERVPFVASQQQPRYTLTAGGETVEAGVVSMGNPHAVLLVDDVGNAPVERLGPLLERHERFPNRANIGFLEVADRRHVRLRVFERGVGETRACGTGACAAVAVGRSLGLLDEDVEVTLPGGRLGIHWSGPGHALRMTGEAITVFEGMIEP
jgi:diaminopimelate epimerase